MFKNITVIGSGLMGSPIAAHFANIGCNVTLLDIVEKNQKNKNHIADQAIKKLLILLISILTKKITRVLYHIGLKIMQDGGLMEKYMMKTFYQV